MDLPNPYQSPLESNPLNHNTDILDGKFISDFSMREIIAFIRNARFSIFLGILPILYIFILWWFIQWFLISLRFPFLAKGDAGRHAALAKDFRSSLIYLVIAVIVWPFIYALCILYRKLA